MDKPVKMVVCDLDGTLLYSSGKITEKTKEVIRKLRREGVLFGVCSGRSAIALQTMLKVWGIDQDVDFVLGFNGGMLYHPQDGKVESWLKLDKKEIPKLIKSFQGYPVAFGEYEDREFLCTQTNPITQRFAARNRLKFRQVLPQELVRNTLKFMAIGMPWTISRYLKEHSARQSGWRMFRSGPFLIEFVNPALSKLEGVRRIAEEYGLELDEIMSFGNDNNDKEMLAGTIGVAMGNALPEIKEAAAYVCGSNKKDGVARFLEDHVLQKHS